MIFKLHEKTNHDICHKLDLIKFFLQVCFPPQHCNTLECYLCFWELCTCGLLKKENGRGLSVLVRQGSDIMNLVNWNCWAWHIFVPWLVNCPVDMLQEHLHLLWHSGQLFPLVLIKIIKQSKLWTTCFGLYTKKCKIERVLA